MIRGRSGQAMLEAVIIAPLMVVLLAAGGFFSLCPLAVFFVEDHMEEALQCSVYQASSHCLDDFKRQLRRSGVQRWIADTDLSCGSGACRAWVRWTWPAPLPRTTVRSLERANL